MPTKEIAPGVLAVTELPEDAYEIGIKKRTLYGYKTTGAIYWDRELPPGSWSIVGWSDELTYEQKGFICKRENRYFEDYCGDGYLFTSVTLSFASLLRSHGITDRALIIKKEK